MKVSQILDQIDEGAVALPEFQRGYVWNRNQVRALMDSMYHKHPVGGLLVWVTKTEHATRRGGTPLPSGTVKLLLDGQQRITSLYGIIRGRPPAFFDGNKQSFTGLYFNLESESFEFYAPIAMKDNPLWFDVTDLIQNGAGPHIGRLYRDPELEPRADVYSNRLNAIGNIIDTDLHIDEVTGDDKNVDVVVEIFNKVNSGGTKLSKGDLALAKVCAEWPEARQEMKSRLNKWKGAGFHLKLDWLLRCVNAIVTGEALFTALSNVTPEEFKTGLTEAERSVDYMLNLISSRLGLDHDRVFGSRYSFPLMVRYLVQQGGDLADYREREKLLYWYIHTFLWGRYASATETVLNQDLAAIEQRDGLDTLVGLLRRNRGDLEVRPQDFKLWSLGARFYPMMYMLTRVEHALDWDTGVELSDHLLGHLSGLQVHHIFPKSVLYKHGYTKDQVNQIANFAFLTQATNLRVTNREPAEYLEEYAAKHPGALESHWIPMDRELWKIENYLAFLDERRTLLAVAANSFLNGLLNGSASDQRVGDPVMDHEAEPLGGIQGEAEEMALLDTNVWVADQGLPEGEFSYELVNEATGDAMALIDLAWPDGLQEGFSQPVALILEEDAEVETIVNQAGYLFFTDVDSFKSYVLNQILAVGEAAD